MNIHCEACRNCSFRIGVLTYNVIRKGPAWVESAHDLVYQCQWPPLNFRWDFTLRVETITKGTRWNLNLFDAVKNAHQIRLRHLQFSAVSLQMRANPQPKNVSFFFTSKGPTNSCIQFMFDYIWYLLAYTQIQYSSSLRSRWGEEKQRTQRYTRTSVSSVFLFFVCVHHLQWQIFTTEFSSEPFQVVV